MSRIDATPGLFQRIWAARGLQGAVLGDSAVRFSARDRVAANNRATTDSKLIDLKQAAAKLGVTEDQVRGFVKDGDLKFINVGRGKKRPRMRFTEADLNDLIERRRKVVPLCLSTNPKSHRIGSTISKSGGIGFMARQDARLAKMPKSLKL